ncbi:MAG: hypothetical protein O2807_03725 [bacterium]|nr:hypothetical protein [bacterium]
MPRIPELPDDGNEIEVQEFFEKQKETYGFILNPQKIYGYRPSIMLGYAALSDGVNDSGLLPDGLKAMLCTRVATFNGCPF